MIRINLIPYRQERRLKLVQQIIIAWIIAGFLGVLIAFAINSYMEGLVEEQEAIKRQNAAEIAKLEGMLGELTHLNDLKKAVQKRLDVIATLRMEKDLSVHVLDEISNLILDQVWLQSINTTGNRLTLSGTASSNDEVARYMRSLEKSPYFANIELTRIAQKTEAGLSLKSFDIFASIINPAAAIKPVDPKGVKK